MLKNKDGAVRDAQNQLADVTSFFADNKDNLAGALKELGTALGNVKTFIQDNRGSLKAEVDKLAPLTQILVDQRASLAEALDTAPLAAGNALNAYDPVHRTLDGRGDINEISMGGDLVRAPQPGGRGQRGARAGAAGPPESAPSAAPSPRRHGVRDGRRPREGLAPGRAPGPLTARQPSSSSGRLGDDGATRRHRRRTGAALGAGVAVVVALALTLGSCSVAVVLRDSTSCRCPAAPTWAATRTTSPPTSPMC